MAKIAISPSQQPHNRYADGSGSEQDWMRRLADKVAPLLRQAGHSVYVINTGHYIGQAPAANRWGADYYVSLHTNATVPGAKPRRGVEAYQNGGKDPVGTRLGKAICKHVSALGIPNRGLYDGSGFAEVNTPHAPCILMELDYHDNPAGATWIRTHLDELANAVVNGIIDIAGGTRPATQNPTPKLKNEEPTKEEEDDDMTTFGLAYPSAKNTTTYLIGDTKSGFYHEYSAGAGRGPMGKKYNDGLASAFKTGNYSSVTASHARVIKAALDKVRSNDATVTVQAEAAVVNEEATE